MIDLHCHILPGLDDGPATIEESLEMAEAAIADGITHVVATPHSSTEFFFDYPKIRSLCKELQAKVGPRLTLATGCDFHLNPENVASLKTQSLRFCINQKDYLLLEFNEIAIPPAVDQTLHEMQLAGVRPIITHPERNRLLRVRPERLMAWVRHGCYGQVTGGALTGTLWTERAKNSLAMDWHRPDSLCEQRCAQHQLAAHPTAAGVRSGGEGVRKRKSARAVCGNPKAAFEGRDLPHVPELEEETYAAASQTISIFLAYRVSSLFFRNGLAAARPTRSSAPALLSRHPEHRWWYATSARNQTYPAKARAR